MNPAQTELDALIERWLNYHQQQDVGFPTAPHDNNWPSLCEIPNTLWDGQIQWRPIKRECSGDFSNLEKGLEMSLHPDLAIFYGQYWSHQLDVFHKEGPVYLLQAWNEQDYENLQKNLIGHVLMKRQLKQEETLFLGLTDQEDLIITMLNRTGEIVLEQVGKPPHFTIADNLESFLQQLSPVSLINELESQN
ncbi:MAG: SecY-interacting protein [Pseudomonadota bacterium]